MELSLVLGALIHVEGDSKLALRGLPITKNGNSTERAMQRSVAFELLNGVVFAAVQFQPAPGGYLVRTPHGELSIDELALCRWKLTGAGYASLVDGSRPLYPRGIN